MAQRNQKDWRELCAAVANETDSNKLGPLVQELIKALDEREQNWRSPIDPFRDSRVRASDSGVSPKSRHDLRTIGRSSRHSVWILGGVLYRGSSFNLGFPDWEK